MQDYEFFLSKFEKIKSPAKSELFTILRLWLCEGKSDDEIALALGGKNRSTATRKIGEICEHFGTNDQGKKTQRQLLVLLFRKYCQDFKVHPTIYPEWIENNFRDRFQSDRFDITKFSDVNNLGAETLDFVGREIDLNNLKHLWQQQPKTKIALIKGSAGVGKTRLAEEFLKLNFKKVIELKIGLESGNITPAEEKVSQILQESFGISPSLDFQKNLSILKTKLSDPDNPIGVLIDNIEPALDSDFRLREDSQVSGYRDLLGMLSHHSICSFTLITSRRSVIAQQFTLREYPLKGLDIRAWQKFFHDCKDADSSDSLVQMWNSYSGNSKVMHILHGSITNRFDHNIEAYWHQYKEALLADHELETLISVEMEWLQNNQPDAYNLLCRMSCYRYQDVKTVPFKGLLCLLWDVTEPLQKDRVLNYLIKTSLIEVKIEYYLHPAVREAAMSRLIKNGTDWQQSNREAAKFWTLSIDQIRNIDDALKVLEAYYHYLNIGDFEMASQVLLTKKDNLFNASEELGYSLLKFGLVSQVTNNASRLLKDINNLSIKASITDILAFAYWLNGDINQCLKCHKSARKISINLNSEKLKIQSIYGIASCAFSLGEVKKAWKLLELVYSMIKGTGYYAEFADAHWSLALFSSFFCTPEKTRILIKEGLEIDLSKARFGALSKGYRFIMLGLAYKNIGEPEKCFDLFQNGLLYAQEINSDLILALAKNSLATIYRENNDFCTSISYHLEAISILTQIGAKCDLAEAYLQTGLTYEVMKDYKQSDDYKLKALVIFEKIKAPKQCERIKIHS